MTKHVTTIDPRMVKARSQLIMRKGAEFWATLAMQLRVVEDRSMPMMATDMVHLFYNPAFLDALIEEERRRRLPEGELIIGTIAHEVDHCAKKHPLRIGKRDLKRFNEAADYQLNGDMLKAGFHLPEGFLFDPQYDGLSAEDIYRLREQQQQQEESKDDQDESDTQGSGKEDQASSGDHEDSASDDRPDGDSESDRSDSNERDTGGNEGGGDVLPDDADGPEEDQDGAGDSGGPDDGQDSDPAQSRDAQHPGGTDPADDSMAGPSAQPCDAGSTGCFLPAACTPAEAGELEAEWELNIRQAINVAVKAAGCVPGGLENLIKEMREPKQDWRAILRAFVDPSSRKDYSWSKPNRRFSTAPFVLPGMVTDGVNHVGVIIDGSGSTMIPGLQETFVGELQCLVDDGIVDRFTFLFCDTEVYEVVTIMPGEKIERWNIRGGGTLLHPAFKWFDQEAPDVSAVLCFTDMYLCDWAQLRADPPVMPVLWCAFGDPRHIRPMLKEAPGGEMVELTVD